MTIRDLIPWNRSDNLALRHREDTNPFLSLHREMNRLFDDMYRGGFDLAPFGAGSSFGRAVSWPNIELSETDKEVKVVAELPGLDAKDVDVELANGNLVSRVKRKPRARTRISCSASAITDALSGVFLSTRWMKARSRRRSKTACSQ